MIRLSAATLYAMPLTLEVELAIFHLSFGCEIAALNGRLYRRLNRLGQWREISA